MSRAADIERSKRQGYAAPGGTHDKLITLLKIALPAAVGALGAVLAVSPLTHRDELSFVLDKREVAKAPNRLSVSAALYRGEDNKGRPFTLQAGSVVQKSSQQPTVNMDRLLGRLMLSDGPAELRAGTAHYQPGEQMLTIDGPIQFDAPGYSLYTSDVTANLNDSSLQSRGAVTGRTDIGSFSADHLSADLDQRVVRLTGHARLRVVPRKPR